MDYVLEFEEVFGYENVEEMKKMEDLVIKCLPYMNNDPYEDIDYFKNSLTKYKKMNVSKYNDAVLKLYVSEKIENYMKHLLRTYAWDNYKLMFCLEWYEENQENIYLLKYKDYCFDFNSCYSYKLVKGKLIQYKPMEECFDELNITENDIHQIFISVPSKDNNSVIRSKLKKLKNKARFIGPSKFKEKILKEELIESIPDFNANNDFFFEEVDEDEIEDYIILNSSDEDLKIFYDKYSEENNAVIN